MRRPQLRRGFTLIEMIIAVVIIAIVGASATRMLTVQTRFFDLMYAKRGARAVGRNSMNVLLSDLQMVQDSGGIDSLSTTGRMVRVRVPYRFGMVCGSTAGTMTASMLPADSAVLAQAAYKGYAYRSVATGRYVYVTGTAAPITAATPATCTGTGANQAGLQLLSMNGRTGANMDMTPGAVAATVRQPIFFWQKISYYFQASTAYPGYYGLFRNVAGGNTDELMAPFDTTARFRIYKMGDDTSRTTMALADTSFIVGLDVVLPGKTTQTLIGYAPKVITMTTSVFFKNTRKF